MVAGRAAPHTCAKADSPTQTQTSLTFERIDDDDGDDGRLRAVYGTADDLATLAFEISSDVPETAHSLYRGWIAMACAR